MDSSIWRAKFTHCHKMFTLPLDGHGLLTQLCICCISLSGTVCNSRFQTSGLEILHVSLKNVQPRQQGQLQPQAITDAKPPNL